MNVEPMSMVSYQPNLTLVINDFQKPLQQAKELFVETSEKAYTLPPTFHFDFDNDPQYLNKLLEKSLKIEPLNLDPLILKVPPSDDLFLPKLSPPPPSDPRPVLPVSTVLPASQKPLIQRITNFIKEALKRILVMAVYTTLTVAHVAATAISAAVETVRDTALLVYSLIKGKSLKDLYHYERTKLHFTAARLALFYMYSFIVPENHPRSNHFDLHHMSYGLASILVPGRLTSFGKWQIVDEIGNYDELGIFRDKGGKKEHKMFQKVEGQENAYALLDHAGKWDGNLNVVAPRFNCVIGHDTVKGPMFPADNVGFQGIHVAHERPWQEKIIIKKKFWPELIKESLYLKCQKPMLDQVASGVNHVVDNIFQPQLEKQKKDPSALQLPWILKDLDFRQFKV